MQNIFESICNYFIPPRIKTKKVLVIDDSKVDQMIAIRALSKHYHVVAANNGREGVEVAIREQPNLIVLDYMMPDINGPEVCRILKENARFQHTPVIFLTSMDTPQTVIDSLEQGAEAYLTKPIGMRDLVEQVDMRIEPVIFEEKSA